MNASGEIEEKQLKKKKRRKGCLVGAGILFVLVAAGLGIGWSFISKEHKEAAGLPLNAVDFDNLRDGKYYGAYTGGMYKWRANECEVTVQNGKVIDIELKYDVNQNADPNVYDTLYERVIAEQTLQVDIISMATLTSKAYLQAVENALVQAERP
jgi:uncharacterized protein with FMN-binding domain